MLGTAPGNEAKWENCDLAKVLLTEESVQAAPVPTPPSSSTPLELPQTMNFGIDKSTQQLLFHSLPAVSAQKDFIGKDMSINPQRWMEQINEAEAKEVVKSNILARVVDMRNASAKGIAFENRRRCVEEFSEPGKSGDTGRPEVQGTVSLTSIRIVPYV